MDLGQPGLLALPLPPIGRRCVVVVDDNELNLRFLASIARRLPAVDVHAFSSSSASLDWCISQEVDCFVLDYRMPAPDGIAMIRQLRSTPAHANVPIIMVTGDWEREVRYSALDAGANDFLEKPIDFREFTSRISTHLALHTARKQMAMHVNQLEESLREESERAAEQARLLEGRLRHHAERLEGLWRAANNSTLRGPELIHAMLVQSAAVIRSGQRFCGVLSQIERDEVVVIGMGIDLSDDDPRMTLLHVGVRTPIEQTIIPRVGRTQAFEDLAAMADLPRNTGALGWRAAISTNFEAGGYQYALVFASSEPATQPFDAEDFGYIKVLAAAFAKQLQVHDLEDSLREAEERSRQHAERLEVLWQIINDPGLHDDELWMAMLRHAAATIQPGLLYRATFRRIQGSEAILEACVEIPDDEARSGEPSTSAERVIPLEGAVIGKVLAEGGGTHSWDDVQAVGDAVLRVLSRGWHAMLVTTFSAGGSTWSLAFSSKERAARPLGAQERAYIDVLASFFANHVQQRWQFERIQYQQAHDVLTGLLNRSQFRSQARAASNEASRFAIVLVDVNAFREINESYGHMIGDALLVEVGTALRQHASADEIVGRVGGDVFGIYLPDPASNEFVHARALDFAQVFARSFSTGDRDGRESIALTASLGVAVASDDGVGLDTLLSRADVALFAAKERGHGSIVFYERGMEGDAQRRSTLRNELIAAIAGNQFALYYQPHVDIGTRAVTGCEALIRWLHPTRGLLLPAQFIPFAEQTGIITSIDDWVMVQAFATAQELRALQSSFRLYFNLSGRQAGDPKLVRAFSNAAREGVPLENLGVEITETDAMRDAVATRRVFRALRKLGVRIAIDDFGTGYSSLAALKQLPIDIVKIDRTFISGLLNDLNDKTITETIISISERFGFESLAVGVEQQAEIDWLRAHLCRYAQGYAICRPLALPEFKSWLRDYRS